MRVRRRKRCLWCGRYFRPDCRAGENQKCCGRSDCRHQRHAKAQQKWIAANPGCFTGRYANTKAWRQENPGYQRQWRGRSDHGSRDTRRDSPRKAIKINKLQKVGCEIQDEMDIQTNRQYSCGDATEGTGHGDDRNISNGRNRMGGSTPIPSPTTRPRCRGGAVGVHPHRGDQTTSGGGSAATQQLPTVGRVQEISVRQKTLHPCGSDSGGGG